MKDRLHRNLSAMLYLLTPEQVLESRENRNWELYDRLDINEKLIHRMEELSIYEDIFEDLTEDKISEIVGSFRNY